jgi:outer-membrane receptor for ferric coprogen and ferric-rhodotorulic acid
MRLRVTPVSTPHRRALPRALALAFGLALAGASAAATPDALHEPRDFHISAGPLAQALNRLAEQGDTVLVYDASLTTGLQAPAVDGRLATADALQRLLAHSGLQYQLADDGSVRLHRVAAPARPAAAGREPSAAPVPTPRRRNGGGIGSGVEELESVDVHGVTEGYAANEVSFGKLALSPREMPSSISVITRQRMDDQNMATVYDVLNRTTGITAVPYGVGTSYFQSRGYQPDVQFDGIPANNGLQYQSQFDLAMYDRLEIFRGPAGILQGQGSPGGTVNLVRKRPLDEASWGGSVSAGSWNTLQATVDGSTPLNSDGTIRGRAVVSAQDHDYFYDKANSRHQFFYGVVEFDLSPSTTLTLSSAYQHEHNGPLDWGQSVYAIPPHGQVLDAPRSQFYGTTWSYDKPNLNDYYAELDHDFGNDWHGKVNVDRRTTTDASKYGYIDGLVMPNNQAEYWLQRQYTDGTWRGGDIDVSGPYQLFGRTQELIVGFNYAKKTADSWNGGYDVPGGADVMDLGGIARPEIPFTSRSLTETTQYGLYAATRIHPAEHWSVLLGSQLTNYRSKSRTGTPTPMGPWADAPDVDHKASPYLGVVYDINAWLSAYASYTTVFVPQDNLTFSGAALKPRTGKQYETGLKGEFLDGRLTASFAAFRLRDQNRAYDDPDHPTYFIAAGKAESQGWEAEVSGRLAPGWDLQAGYTYLLTRYLKDASSEGQVFDSEEPKKTFKLWSVYRFEGDTPHGFRVGGGARVLSSTTRGTITQSGYAVFDGQVGYQFDRDWLLTLTVNNVFDRKYFARVPASYFGIYGDPRNTMLTLRKSL